MLDRLDISGFKCFDDIKIPLKRITLLTGTNSSGKSSVIQALLLLANNAMGVSSSPMNNMLLQLGRFEECRNHITNSRSFVISAIIEENDERFSLQLTSSDEDEELAVVDTIHNSVVIEKLLSPREKHLFYIPANRIGPMDSHRKNFDSQNFLGAQAEFIVDYLFRNQKRAVIEELQKDVSSITLLTQVNYWLNVLLGSKLAIIENKGSNSYSIEYNRISGKAVRPYHIGSGVSYSLSVVVSCLSAQKDDIVILENPEIHLHPRAQAELTEFLCFVAAAGVQIIIETHSDHVFNGIRKAIVKNTIQNTDTSTQFFVQKEDGLSENVTIEINKHGRVLKHRKGLFDQFDEDLDAILEI